MVRPVNKPAFKPISVRLSSGGLEGEFRGIFLLRVEADAGEKPEADSVNMGGFDRPVAAPLALQVSC